jgi:signal transduction histidine kinase
VDVSDDDVAPFHAGKVALAWAEDDVGDSGDPGAPHPGAGSDPWDLAPVGLALTDADGVVGEINSFGRELLRRTDPVEVLSRAIATGLVGRGEQAVGYEVDGQRRLLSCRLSMTSSGGVLAFRDVTRAQHRQRRVVAVASAAASVASERSLTASLGAMAQEVVRADGLAGVQILATDRTGDEGLRIMGTAGFAPSPRFFELLMVCRERGASLRMLEAFETGQPVIVPHRYDVVMKDPAWEPLRDILRHPRWDAFASVPVRANGRRIGILNAFFTPGQVVDDDAIGFLRTMADQAALAIDYARLLEQQRRDAGQAERQRLARELHDSIVQQVFSIGMQTEAVKLLAARADEDSRDRIRVVARELEEMTQSVLADLRNVVTQLHPVSPAVDGLATALRELVETTRRRTGIGASVSCPEVVDELDPDLAEDVYFIVAEAVHNAIKHAGATDITVLAHHDAAAATVELVVADDGCGFDREPERWQGGYGLTSMRERAERWGGWLEVCSDADHGTRVTLCVPQLTSGPGRPEEVR